MDIQVSIDVQAPAEIVWNILADVEHWPEWTKSVTRVRWLDDGSLNVGSRAHIEQPKRLPVTWQVTELQQNRSFTWASIRPGLGVTGGHSMEVIPNGTRVTLSINFAGFLGPLIGRMTRSLTERYMRMEADGLKARSEQQAQSPSGASSVSGSGKPRTP